MNKIERDDLFTRVSALFVRLSKTNKIEFDFFFLVKPC